MKYWLRKVFLYQGSNYRWLARDGKKVRFWQQRKLRKIDKQLCEFTGRGNNESCRD